MLKIQQDRWNASPARVSSFLEIPPPELSRSGSQSKTYPSLRCGLGWKFDITFAPYSSSSIQKIGRVTVKFEPDLCSRMPYGNLTMTVDVKTSTKGVDCVADARRESFQQFSGLRISDHAQLGTYDVPFHLNGRIIIEIMVMFGSEQQLSFPTSPSPGLSDALASSLDGQALIDAKFYLFSTRSMGKPASPRATFGNSVILKKMATYFKDLLSDAHFQDGVLCDVHDDVPTIRERLRTEMYDYEDDSDLEDLQWELEANPPVDVQGISAPSSPTPPIEDEITAGLVPPAPPVVEEIAAEWLSPPLAPPPPSVEEEKATGLDSPTQPPERSSSVQPKSGNQVHAYAINGFAHRTWKSFIFYMYTHEIHFNQLKSQPWSQLFDRHELACSPKSMYRLADYVNIPNLKALAKEGISNGLSEENVVEELFSPFTSKYDEIIELEANFLISHFTPQVSATFDDAVGQVVHGLKPYYRRSLLFTIKRLHDVAVAEAWEALKESVVEVEPQSPSQPPTTASERIRSKKKGELKKSKLGG